MSTNAGTPSTNSEAEAAGFSLVDHIDGGELSRLIGSPAYGCSECGAMWNAGDAHLTTCSRRPGDAA